MKLRSIEISGFKSFRDRVLVEIGDGMTCIVGPNGCGKSNVVDAIKWAMGDMSPKSLRGDSMQDVIFAGTETRKPSGMAEVTLTFENQPAEGEEIDYGDSVPREFRDLSEIAITRRLHRCGESEYLINKVSCRLRDIRSLLAGTGLGKQGYSIIEQGQIGFIVNSRPEERRLIIEEASGITRYKDQRERSERKLARTEQNLARTRDLLDEIGKQMRTLERQAQRAREYKELEAELRGLEVAVLLVRRDEVAEAAEALKKKVAVSRKAAADAEVVCQKREASLQSSRDEAKAAEETFRQVQERFYQTETRRDLAASNRDHALTTVERAKKRRAEIEAEIDETRGKRSAARAEAEQLVLALEEAEEAAPAGDEALAELRSRVARQEAEHRELRDDADRRKEQRDRLADEIRRGEDRLEWISAQIGTLAQRSQDGDGALSAAREEAQCEEERLVALREAGTLAASELSSAREAMVGAKERVETSVSSVREVARHLEVAARRVVELRARQESLESLRESAAGHGEGTRWFMEWAKSTERDGVLGPVSDFLKISEGQAARVTAFLGERLSDVLVRDRETAIEGLERLLADGSGEAACLVIGDADPAEVVRGLVDAMTEVDGAEDLRALSDNPTGGRAWVTSEGLVLFEGGRLKAGFAGGAEEALVARGRELDELNAEVAAADEERERCEEVAAVARQAREQAEEDLVAARERVQDVEHQARGIAQQVEHHEGNLKRAEERRKGLIAELERLSEELGELGAERERLRAFLGESRELLPRREEEVVKAREVVEAGESRLAEARAELTRRQVEAAEAQARRRHLRESLDRVGGAQEEHARRLVRLDEEMEQQAAEAEKARLHAAVLEEEVERLRGTHAELADEVARCREASEAAAARSSELELSVLAARQDRQEALEKLTEVQMARREAELAIAHVEEQLQTQWEVSVAEAREFAAALDVPREEWTDRAQKARRRIQKLGAVNLLAIEEFEETRERHAFHSEQQADLENSVQDLRDAIARMDRESRKRFGETFQAVNAKFQEVFPRLFRGGSARLVLTDPGDLLESGVDIEVNPPGKRLQNVTLLSGGEKALTAVSLILSIFLLKPTPFSVLDEVDAPLDDANVGRFAEMVKELSATSQMIVITHNRRTMEAPERLYGVTMQEAGVSKVVSVKLSELDDRMAS